MDKRVMNPLSAVALSLALGAAVLTGTEAVSETVKDAYAVLKEIIRSRYPKVPIEMLEEDPRSEDGRAVVEKRLEASNAGDDVTLLAAAHSLIELIQSHTASAAGPVGIDLQRIKAANVSLTDAKSHASGVQIRGVVAGTGNIIVGGVVTGVRPIDPWPTPGSKQR